MKHVFILVILFTLGCTEKQLYESASTPMDADVSAKISEDPAPDYSRYVGVYKMQGATFDEVAITQEDGKLFAQASGERKVEIYPEKEHSFTVPAFNARITFTGQSDSVSSGILVWLDGGELQGVKQ